ncbi:MAG: FkbM family methyltransferase [Ignavibacteriales bacterium]|nr:FkbM family methyltransferase [Ignavibacteriales bacterium]
MKLATANAVRERLRSVLFTLFNRLENNNNADFHTNGEKYFLYDYFRSLHAEVVLFDIGANIGGYSEVLIDVCKRKALQYHLHLFEPTQACFATLQQKFSHDQHVSLNNVGVSDANSTSEIFYDAEKSGFASLYQRDLSSMNVSMNKKETIALVRLDTYLSDHNVQRIDFLKIDIEGHELAAFRGLGTYLNAGFIKAIQFEYGGANLDSGTTLKQIYQLLQSSGFRIFKIMKHHIERRPYELKMENYQYANFVALSPKYFPDIR